MSKRAYINAFKSAYNLGAKNVHIGALLNRNESEVDVYIDGLTTPISSSQTVLLNTLVKDLKNGLNISALSDAFDTMYVLAGETEESSLRNLVKNANYATAVNSPNFTAFEGFKGDGLTSYLNSNYNPNTEGVRYTKDNSSISVYVRQMHTMTSAGTMMFALEDGTNFIRFIPNRTGSSTYWNLNSVAESTALGLSQTTNGIYTLDRSSNSNFNFYRNNVLVENQNKVSSSIPNGDLYLLARNNIGLDVSNWSSSQISIVSAGKSFTKAEQLIINNAIEAYMDANGKGIVT